MLELLVCALFTIFPDCLYRRYGQGKRFGKEITLYSVWFEPRWGLVTCVMLTLGLITVIFYNHPSTTNAAVFFRTVPIVPEINGRVAQVHVGFSEAVAKGAPIFTLDSRTQQAAAQTKISTLLPAERASAAAALAQAEVEPGKTVARAGFAGRVEQFTLRVGDVVNPFMRPAGTIIPAEAGRGRLQAGFSQIEAQVIKVGMAAEVTCVSKPWTIIPMVVTGVQDFIAAGQIRSGEQLLDAQQVVRPGTILTFLEPLYEGGLDGVTPGSNCIANAYSSNHEAIAAKETGTFRRIVLHAVDTAGLAHALLLRIQAQLLPIRTLVLSGH